MPELNENSSGPLYHYKCDTVGNLLMCLKPHTLRHLRTDLIDCEKSGDIEPHQRRMFSELIEAIDDLVISLEGEP